MGAAVRVAAADALGGGYRLYSAADESRVTAMRENLERGLSAAEAARLTLAQTGGESPLPDTPVLEQGARQMRAALDGLDEAGATAALDRLLAELSLETVLREVVLPYLRELGERWERGDVSIGQEHFASGVLRGRLLGLARGWGQGGGPHAVLACAPGEFHELGLIAFGLSLRDRNWRITYLGPDTPLATIAEIAATLRPDAVVIAATPRRTLRGSSRRWPLSEVAVRSGSQVPALTSDSPRRCTRRCSTSDRSQRRSA